MNKSLFIIFIIAIFLLIGGGFVLYTSFFAQPSKTSQDGGLLPFFGLDSNRDNPTNTQNNNDKPSASDGIVEPVIIPKLRQLWNEPSSGVFIGDGIIRFVDRATGHVYQTSTTTTLTTRITNTTIPKIQETLWPTANRLIIRYLRENDNTIETFAGTIVETATTSENISGELRGQFLPKNIIEIAVQNDGTLFYLTKKDDSVFGTISSYDGTSAREIFSSVIKDWVPQWVGSSSVALTTKEAAGIPGSFIALNTGSGSLTPIVSNIFGLTTNTLEDNTYYTQNDGNGLDAFVFNKKTGISTKLFVETPSEKCVWSNKEVSTLYCAVPKNAGPEVLPDDWYKGLINFEDSLWKIDTTTGTGILIFDPNTITNTPLDMIDLRLNEDENYLVFRNKTDQTPWLLRLSEEEVPEEVGTTTPEN